MSNNQVLLTGASGFLGKYITEALNGKYQLYTIGRSAGNDQIVDITSEFSLNSENFEFVVHCAGKVHSIPSNSLDEAEFYAINFKGTKNLTSALNKQNKLPGCFIFISSVAVYGLYTGTNIDEDSPLLGESPYARSKRMAEDFLLEWGKEKEVAISILRLALIFGKEPPGNLGVMLTGIRTGRYFRIGNGAAKKSMVWPPDVAKIIPVVLEKGGVYNLTDGYHPKVSELEEALSKVLKRKIKSIPYTIAVMIGWIGDLVGRRFPINSDGVKKLTSTLTFSDAKARNELGWKPSKVLDHIDEILM